MGEAADFMGEQAMCGCVEDMNPVARVDCTEAIGLANYTLSQDQETGQLKIEYVQNSFEIEFRACQGWQYKADITPETYQSAEYEKVVVGYTHPEVNRNDDEREKVCKEKFDAKFPDKQWKKVVPTEEDEELEV